MTIAGIVVGAITTLGALALVPTAKKASLAALERMPLGASWALAWGAGVLVAFAGSLQSLRRDHEEGIVALALARGHRIMSYVTARVLGLAMVLFIVVAGGSMIVGLASTALARGPAHVAAAAQATVAACVYSTCFAIVVAPVALAALGARSRAGGYLSLLLVLVVPELLAKLTARLVPEGWEELVSVPGILSAVRSALAPPAVDPIRLVRALVMVAIVSLVAIIVVRAQAARVVAEGARS
jgi:hypothetical protein